MSKNEEQAEYEDILRKIQDGAFLDKILKSEEWSVFRDASKYVSDEAKKALLVVNPDDKTQIVRLQLQAQFYEDVLQNIINQCKIEAEQAYENAKDRGWLGKVSAFFQTQF